MYKKLSCLKEGGEGERGGKGTGKGREREGGEGIGGGAEQGGPVFQFNTWSLSLPFLN